MELEYLLSFINIFLMHLILKIGVPLLTMLNIYNINFSESDYKGKMLEIPPGKMMPKHSHEGRRGYYGFPWWVFR